MLIKWQPKQFKFKRLQKGVLKNCQFKVTASKPHQGSIGLRALKSGVLTSKQLEQARRKLLKFRKKKEKNKIWFRCIPDIPITKKPLGIRMGKGKGSPKYWIFRLAAGSVILQLSYMTRSRSAKGLILAKKALPIPTKVVYNKSIRRPMHLQLY